MIFDMEIVNNYMEDTFETALSTLIQNFQNIEEQLEYSSTKKMMSLLIQYLAGAKETDTEE